MTCLLAKQNEIRVHISAENQEFVNKMKEIIDLVKDTKTKTEQNAPKIPEPTGLVSGLVKASALIGSVYAGLTKLKEVAESFIGTGFKFNQTMETGKLGIGGILMSMTKINGRQLELNEALELSNELLNRIQISAAKIGLPADEMMSAFQSVIGPGLSAKMTLEELVNFVPTATKAVKTMLGSMANEMQVTQELRAMISGDIDMNAQVSRSLGITRQGVEEAKQTAGGLFNYLMEKMSGFKAIAVEWPNTMTGALEKFKTSYSQASGSVFEKSFDKAKDKLNELTDKLFVVNKETKLIEFNPELLNTLESLADNAILLTEKIITVGNTVIPYLGSPLQIVGNILKFIVDNVYGVTTALGTWIVIQRMITLFELARTRLVELRTAAATAMATTTGGATTATVAVGRLETALFAVKTAIRGLASATLWGAIAVAAGVAVEKIVEHFDKIDQKKKKLSEQTDKNLGWLSAGHEGNADSVSSGENDPWGGISYGKWQFSSKQGTADKFVDWLIANGWEAGNFLKYGENVNAGIPAHEVQVGTEEFESLWHQAFEKFGDSFENAQRSFMKENYYDPFRDLLKENMGLDADARSKALKEVLISTSVQHGLGGAQEIMANAANIAGVPNASWLTDEQLIPYIYEARRKAFPQDKARYDEEEPEAMQYLAMNPQKSSLGKVNLGDIEVKAQEAAEAEIKKSQNALKLATQQMQANAELEKAAITKKLENLEYEKENLGIIEYAKQKAQLQYDQAKIDVDVAQGKKDLINNALYKEKEDKTIDLDKAENEIKVAAQKLSDFGENVADVNRILGKFSEEGTTWKRSEADNPDIDGLKDPAKNAISMLGDYFYKLTGQQLTVSSGLRNWGGHVSGLKFDVVDDAANTLLEDNVNGIRDAIVSYARSLGIKVLNAYEGDEGPDAPGHLDFDATDFNISLEAKAKKHIGNAHSKVGKEIYDGILQLYQDADEIIQKLNEAKGDIASSQKEQLNKKYNELISKFSKAGLTELADKVKELKAIEFNNIDFAQTQKDLENANTDLVNYQEELLNDITDGSKTSGDATQNLIDKHHELFDKYLSQLKEQLDIAISSGNREKVYQIRAEMKTIVDKITDGIQAILKRIDDNLDDEITRLNANLDLTNMQRDDAIEAARRKAAANKVVTLNERLNDLQEKSSKMSDEDKLQYKEDNNGLDIDHEILVIEKQIELNQELSKTPSLLDNIHRSSKQAFEDGLLDFLERGILECENLGDAFRNLAITILQAIQKVYSEALTKNIMQALGLGNSKTPGRPSIGGKAVQGPLRVDGTFAEGGRVEGPGTETSDSILARLSRGEFVINAAAVRKIGLHNLERINTGDIYNLRIPMPKFATGGYVGQVGARSAEKGMSVFGKTIGTNVSAKAHVNFTVVRNEAEALKYALSTREGADIMLNWNKQNGMLLSRTYDLTRRRR